MVKRESRIRGGVVVLLVAGLMATTAVAGAQEQQQQQQQQQPSFGLSMNQPSQAEQDAIQQIYTTDDPEQKLVLIKDFIAKYPDSPLGMLAYSAAAQAYRRQNKWDQVAEYGEKAIELSGGRDGITMLFVADALSESTLPIHADYKEKLAKAEAHARRALEVLPEMFAGMTRREGTAEEVYVQRQRHLEGWGHAILGNVYLRQNQQAKAVEELTKAIETEGYQPDGVDFQRLGLAHMRQQQLKEAEAAFQKCVDRGASSAGDCQQRIEQVRQRMAAQEKPQP